MTEEMKQEEVPKAEPTADQKDIEENKIMAVIAYIGILCLIPLLAKKDSPFAQFHGKQGLVLFIAGIIVGAVSALPFIGWFIVAPLGSIFILILAIMGIINAAQGKMKELPLIGQFGKKINF
jgi:uncharacterized membrane protein